MNTNIEEMRKELDKALAVLQDAGERWLEVKASGNNTDTVAAEVAAAERASRKLERDIHRAQQRQNRR